MLTLWCGFGTSHFAAGYGPDPTRYPRGSLLSRWYHCSQLQFRGTPWAVRGSVEKAWRVWLEGQPGEVQIPQKLCEVFGACHFCRRMAPISWESQGHHRDAKTAGGHIILCLHWHGPVFGQVPTWFGSTAPVVTKGGEVVVGNWGTLSSPGGERNVDIIVTSCTLGGKAWVACVEKAQRVWLEDQPGEVQIPQKLCGVFGTWNFCRRMAPISQESQGHHRDAKTARSQIILCLPWNGPVLGQLPTWFGYSPGSTPPVVTEEGGVVEGSWATI